MKSNEQMVARYNEKNKQRQVNMLFNSHSTRQIWWRNEGMQAQRQERKGWSTYLVNLSQAMPTLGEETGRKATLILRAKWRLRGLIQLQFLWLMINVRSHIYTVNGHQSVCSNTWDYLIHVDAFFAAERRGSGVRGRGRSRRQIIIFKKSSKDAVLLLRLVSEIISILRTFLRVVFYYNKVIINARTQLHNTYIRTCTHTLINAHTHLFLNLPHNLLLSLCFPSSLCHPHSPPSLPSPFTS